MNKYFYGAYDNKSKSLLTHTGTNTPVLASSRSAAREIVKGVSDTAGAKFKVVRIGFNIEHRIGNGSSWTPVETN